MKSKSFPERIALIEFDSSHDECLLTQINALKKRGCWVLLITNDLVRNRNHHLESLVDEWRNIDSRDPDNCRKGLTGAAIGDAMIIRRLMRSLKKLNIDKVIFNTAQGGHVRNACLFSLFRKIEFIGIIHTARKFQGSFTQKLISLKIKKYFVLANFLKEEIPNPKKITVKAFYPIDYPEVNNQSIKQDDTLHIALIGSVEERRKDLKGFISLIQQCDSSVRFYFLGKANPEGSNIVQLKNDLENIGYLDRVTFHDSYVNSETIDSILRKTSAILPLIHPFTSSADEYFHFQIPGSMNMALGYKIPLLIHESYREEISELNTASIYYQLDSFSTAINELKIQNEEIRLRMRKTKKYSSAYQYDQVLSLVFN